MFWNTVIVPPVDGEYLVTCSGAIRCMILSYENGKWIDDYGTQYDVIAWLPLPPAYDPKGYTIAA